MSTRGTEFANGWIQENIHIEAYDPPKSMIDEAVQRLLSDAKADGISRGEIEEDMGDLHDFISAAYKARTDDEVERLASRDD